MKLTTEIIENSKERKLSCKEIAAENGYTISGVINFCKRHEISPPKTSRGGQNVKDISNKKYGSLTVIDRAGSNGKLATWNCLCVCGKTIVSLGSDLRQGKIKTCGCRVGIKSKRNWQGHGDIPKSYWSSLTNNALQRNLPFKITVKAASKLWEKQAKMCQLTGLPLSFSNNSASLDRIDNSLGYIRGNVQWVHKEVNKMKSTFSQQRLIELCKLVANYQGENNVTRKTIR